MLATSAIAIFLIAWSAVFLVDYVLRVAHFEPYLRLSHRFGIEVSPFQLRFYITSLPRETILLNDKVEILEEDKKSDIFFEESRRSRCRSLLVRIWFSCGVIASIVCLFGMTFYMSHLLMTDVGQWMTTARPKVSAYRGMEYRSMQDVLTSLPPTPGEEKTTTSPDEMHPVILNDAEYDMIENGEASSSRGLVPIIPGFNLPWNHIPIFMIVLIVAAVFHEIGHAWAATSNGVTVNGFGVFVLALYPGAFTDIEPITLKRSSTFKRLQIFGAGIWHNLLLALLAFGLFHVAPIVVSPVLASGNGVSVKGVDIRSGLSNPRTGLVAGDIVRSVDECPVETVADWWRCIREAKEMKNGRCVNKEAVEAATAFNHRTEVDEILCCDEFNVTTAHVCFERDEKVPRDVETQTRAPQLNALLGLEARDEKPYGAASVTGKMEEETVTKYSCLHARHVVEQAVCNVSEPCKIEETEAEKVCVYPALHNGTRLVKISLGNRGKPILFVGQLNEMLEMVSISPLTPRFSFAHISWLENFELSSKYLFTLSLALGLFNAMPVYSLDGQYIVYTLLKCSGLSIRRRDLIQYLTLTFGTGVLILNVVIGFIKLAVN
uniref:Membrane-bound transcription factor site-2 protease n=1 Tax=Caenorhabditis tropicalis TaxID=1561998 RepID=A0A1I7SXF9_9PELO